MSRARAEVGDGPWTFGLSAAEEAGGCRLAGGEAAVLTARRPGSDDENEDAAALVPHRPTSGVLVLADGFGGAPAGERAARLAIAEVARAVAESGPRGGALRAAVLDGIEAANRAILDLGVGAATTLAAVGITGTTARAFHAGDSAVLVIGGRGKVKWQTVAHSPAGYAVASGWVEESEARRHDEAQVVLNYLGSSDLRIEVGPRLRLAPRDTVLVASDGLTDNLGVEEISHLVAAGRELDETLASLAARARERMATAAGKPDDLTLAAYRRSPAPSQSRSAAP